MTAKAEAEMKAIPAERPSILSSRLKALVMPTIQRMEASEGVIRGNVESLMKLIAALDAAGVDLINEGAISDKGGRGVRLKMR